MRIIKSIAISFLLLVSATIISYAQVNETGIKTTGDGIIQNSGDYKIEMVERENSISFYVLDAKGKTLSNKNVTGTVMFEFFNKTKATNPISLDINNSLLVEVPRANLYTYCIISIIYEGETITSKFKNSQVSEHDVNHGHQH
ncbi:hypothetical protein [Flavobacterium sp. ACAM 123]|uniref:hypothetical protein n=1 Tax=Flavobacterium sp. ACAM 123 TaxID=1189620 RepID=UPI0002F69DF9|nr:hypothetical protein [Flavobacterium sp. ACAM 123]